MNQLGMHHCLDEHKWANGQCSFHPDIVCSCGECEDDLVCEGKAYKSTSSLSCPFHANAYTVECSARAEKASSYIHPELGKGHSNLPEADHHIFTMFRSKDLNIQRLHYIVSTNLALIQSNMRWLMESRRRTYHWICDLYEILGLPLYEDLLIALQDANDKYASVRKSKMLDNTKRQRINMKPARVEENEARKKWVKQQKWECTYGEEADVTVDLADDDAAKIIEESNTSSTDSSI